MAWPIIARIAAAAVPWGKVFTQAPKVMNAGARLITSVIARDRTVAKVVAWKDLIGTAPDVMAEARRLFESVNDRIRSRLSRGSTSVADSLQALRTDVTSIHAELDAFESNQAGQAELISQMAAQEETLVRGMQTLSHRLALLSLAVVTTSAVSIAALLIALLR